ncbi:MAG: sulfatase-like hydrolase/transferase [Deltaproteobacteria bacterium]|nr:sulfatase-like hydrolase/transferase [Deltaproteobacteria bacterium]
MQVILGVGGILFLTSLVALYWGISRRPPPGPSVVLFTMDTVRKDHLGCYGYDKNTSPHLDKLAKEGVIFDGAYTAAVHSATSHASMMTGLPPGKHGLLDNTFALRSDVETAAEAAQSAGARTAAFISYGLVGEHVGLRRGFDDFELNTVPNHIEEAEVPLDVAMKTFHRAAEWIKGNPERFFIWIHAQNAHYDWRPASPYAERFAAAPTSSGEEEPFDEEVLGCVFTLNNAIRKEKRRFSEGEAAPLVARYDGEIAIVDDGLRLIQDAIAESGAADHTTFIVLADHGTTLFDRQGQDYVDHAEIFYEEVLNIPLVVSGPAVPSDLGGKRINGYVETLSVARTIERVLGDGFGHRGKMPEDLFALAAGDRPTLPDEFPERIWMYDAPFRAIREGRFKLMIQLDQGERLYDLATDPDEKNDVRAAHPEVFQRLKKRLRERRAKLVKQLEKSTRPQMSAEVKAMLQQGGYLPRSR